jgi:hypothetical protein
VVEGGKEGALAEMMATGTCINPAASAAADSISQILFNFLYGLIGSGTVKLTRTDTALTRRWLCH